MYATSVLCRCFFHYWSISDYLLNSMYAVNCILFTSVSLDLQEININNTEKNTIKIASYTGLNSEVGCVWDLYLLSRSWKHLTTFLKMFFWTSEFFTLWIWWTSKKTNQNQSWTKDSKVSITRNTYFIQNIVGAISDIRKRRQRQNRHVP